MRISDWSADVCSSDLIARAPARQLQSRARPVRDARKHRLPGRQSLSSMFSPFQGHPTTALNQLLRPTFLRNRNSTGAVAFPTTTTRKKKKGHRFRSEEHTSELQSLMRTTYAVFCL